MIEQQLGFSLESFLRGIVGISTVLGVAYLMSYDRKRVDWKLVGGGLFMQFVFALAVFFCLSGQNYLWRSLCVYGFKGICISGNREFLLRSFIEVNRIYSTSVGSLVCCRCVGNGEFFCFVRRHIFPFATVQFLPLI